MSTDNRGQALPMHEALLTPGYPLRVMSLIEAVHRAADVPEVLELLKACTIEMGATASVFLIAIPEDDERLTLQVLLACNPEIVYEQQGLCPMLEHPWFGYGRDHELPIVASRLVCADARGQSALNLASQHGFASTLILPTPSAAGLGRFGVLCVGSACPGAFEQEDTRVVHLLARSLAAEIYDWFATNSRESLLTASRLMTRDLALLRMERRGLCTKDIARVLGTSSNAVDSQFQRIKARLGCQTRRAAAKRAAEYGLL